MRAINPVFVGAVSFAHLKRKDGIGFGVFSRLFYAPFLGDLHEQEDH